MPDVPQPQVATTKSHDWKKVILTILVILVASGLVVAAYWLLVLNKSSNDSDLTGPVPKVTTKTSTESAKEATSSDEKSETVSLSTYTNKELGFIIKFPSEWGYTRPFANDSSSGVRFAKTNPEVGDKLEGIVIIVANGPPLKPFYDNIFQKKVNELKQVTVSGADPPLTYSETRKPDVNVSGLTGVKVQTRPI